MTAAAGTDTFGNVYNKGNTTYTPSGGAIASTGAQVNNGTLSVGTGAALNGTGGRVPGTVTEGADGILSIDSGVTNNTDTSSSITLYSKNASATTAFTVLNEALGFSAGAVNPSSAFTSLYADTASGALSAGRVSGYQGALPVVRTGTSTLTNANNGTQAITTAWPIPAGDAKAGSVYEVEVQFDGTFQNQTLTWGMSIDGGAPQAQTSIGAGFFVAATVFDGVARIKLMILTTGAAGTFNAFTDGLIGPVTNRSSGTNNNNGAIGGRALGGIIDTTAAHTIAVTAAWGGSTAGQTISGYGSIVTRKGP
jgi:hypothetical protein